MSLNDSSWGRPTPPPNQPDIGRLIQQLKQRFFGKGAGNDNADSPSPFPGPGQQKRLFVGIAVAAVGLWLASGFYIVDAGQSGVVFRFGKYVETTSPGPRWRMPYPIDRVEVINVSQVKMVEVGYRGNVKNKVPKESLILTADENIVDIQFAVQYVLKDPVAFVLNNRNAEESVSQAAESALREIIGKNSMNNVLYEGRAQIGQDSKLLMQDILDRYKTGITVTQVTLQNTQPPEQVQEAFDDAVRAGQDRERQKNEGQAYANDVVPKARGMAARLMEESQGYRQRLIATAEGDSDRFRQLLSEYRKAPQVTRDRLYLETMQQTLGSVNKIITDGKQGLLYLPLDKLLTQSGATPAAGDIKPEAANTNGERAPARPERPAIQREREGR